MQNNLTQRFEADTRSVHLENIWVGVIVAVAAPGMQYLSGIQNPRLLVALAMVGFLAGYSLYTIRNYYQAALAIDISGTGLSITKRRELLQIPWAEIRDVSWRSQYGSFFTIQVESRRYPHVIRLEGYSAEQITTIQELIEQQRI